MSTSENAVPALIEAVKSGDRERVRTLLARGCDVHERGEQDWPALNFAAGAGDLELTRLLVESGADITRTGKDNRSPLMIAKAAGRKLVAEYLTETEKKRGVWKDPAESRKYAKAYYLRDLRRFPGWTEARRNWVINKYWSDELKAEFEKALEDADIVFLHQDFTVTRSMWHGEHAIFDAVTDDWRQFCRDVLAFALPEDLL